MDSALQYRPNSKCPTIRNMCTYFCTKVILPSHLREFISSMHSEFANFFNFIQLFFILFHLIRKFLNITKTQLNCSPTTVLSFPHSFQHIFLSRTNPPQPSPDPTIRFAFDAALALFCQPAPTNLANITYLCPLHLV